MRLALVSLDEPAAAVHKLLNLLLHLVECLLDDRGEITISKAPGRFAFDHQLGAGHLEVDSDLVRVALLVMPVGLVDDHVTTHDPIVNALQPRGRFMDGSLDHPGMGKVVERDLKRSVHGRSLARDDRGGWSQSPVAGGVLLAGLLQPASAPGFGEEHKHRARGAPAGRAAVREFTFLRRQG